MANKINTPIEQKDYKPLNYKGNICIFGRRIGYNDLLQLNYVPYKVRVCLTALARLGEGDNYLCSNKGLKKKGVFD